MKLSVHHSTTFRYQQPLARSTQVIRLTPSSSNRQKVDVWQLDLPAAPTVMTDAFENVTSLLTLSRMHEQIDIVATGTVDVPEVDEGEVAGRVNPRAFLRASTLTEPDDAIRAFCEPMRQVVSTRPLIGATDLMHAVRAQIAHRPGLTEPETPVSKVFEQGGGAWQHQVHVFLACCRLLGLPARYLSGYVFDLDRSRVVCRAWAEVWLANRWVGFDLVLGSTQDGGRIKLACGLDYLDACPLRGVRIGGGDEVLSTVAQVRQVARR